MNFIKRSTFQLPVLTRGILMLLALSFRGRRLGLKR
jgi:hypothetical protein